MIVSLLSRYSFSYPRTIVYMLQSTEYQPRPYLAWYWRTHDFAAVMRRRDLALTKPAKLLLMGIFVGMALHAMVGVAAVAFGWYAHHPWLAIAGVCFILLYPFLWAHLIVVPLLLGRWLIIIPKQRKLIRDSEIIFANHPATKVAIAGSYGKTTMKELLFVVLSEGKKVAATPANKNVAISHAYFARRLHGDEDILLIEYGEGAPGDVTQFATTTHPTIGIITGLAPAHLDRYKTVQAAGEDIFSLASYLHDKQVYVSGENDLLRNFIKPNHHVYSQASVLDWRISDITVGLDGVRFTMRRSKETMHLASKLLGRHQVAPLALVAALARELGLSKLQIETGVAKTQPYEHRMQPRTIGGAWIIDDTYNGNIEGVRVGLTLLKELSADRRKIYVTPGLVDQGAETESVHVSMGQLIADAAPDIVVLMKNSVTAHILEGLNDRQFKGEVKIADDPLRFYTNLDQFVASGDVVLLQNDWTDNYF